MSHWKPLNWPIAVWMVLHDILPPAPTKGTICLLSVFLSLLIQCIIYTGNPSKLEHTHKAKLLQQGNDTSTSECNPTQIILDLEYFAGFWALRVVFHYIHVDIFKNVGFTNKAKPEHTHTHTGMHENIPVFLKKRFQNVTELIHIFHDCETGGDRLDLTQRGSWIYRD